MPSLKRLCFHRVGLVVVAAAIVGTAAGLPADEIRPGFQERVFQDETGSHKYTVFVPAGYTPEQKWPVILYLHGASARGTDNKLPIVGGLGTQIRARADWFPFLVVFPQCEAGEARILYGWEADSPNGVRALKILDAVEREFSVDPNREILTGWSMGGTGAWDIASACPKRWSAVAIVSGNSDLGKASQLKETRIWAFHGTLDHAVSVEQTRRMIAAVRAAGGKPFVTELPGVGHNIGHVVYGDDALYTWMLHPETEPQTDSIVRNATRRPTDAEMGRDLDLPFIPAVEVPDAMYAHLDSSALESLAYAVPPMVPAAMLAGVAPDIRQFKEAAITRFEVVLSGLNYRGQLEQVRVTPRADGWVTVDFGLRNLMLEIASTNVTGMLTAATAGPMEVVVGSREAVWLSVQVRPYIENRQLHLELGNTHFAIPDDNFSVSPPQVTGSGVLFLRNRVASGVAQNLVTQAYAKKGEIEARVTGAVPTLIAKMEEHLRKYFESPRTVFTRLPAPTYVPRFVLWPSQVRVDETGIAMSVGATISRPGVVPVQRPLRRIVENTIDLAKLPKSTGVQLGVSSSMFEGITAAAANADVTVADVRDLGVRKYYALCDRRTMCEIIPDLARFGDDLQVHTRFELIEPVTFRGLPAKPGSSGKGSAGAADKSASTGKRSDRMEIKIANLRAAVMIRTSPKQSTWTRCAEFDIQLNYQARISIEKPTFERRLLVADTCTDPQAKATARFASGFHAIDPTLRAERIAEIFACGWKDEGPREFLGGAFSRVKMVDLVVGTAHMRLADACWVDGYLTCEFHPAATRITNAAKRPIAYQVRGPLSDWGGPYTLEPGKSHDFRVPYPLTIQPLTTDGGPVQPLQMGANYLLQDTQADTMAAVPPVQ